MTCCANQWKLLVVVTGVVVCNDVVSAQYFGLRKYKINPNRIPQVYSSTSMYEQQNACFMEALSSKLKFVKTASFSRNARKRVRLALANI
jgi:hypothetical protein